jgi:carboxymethylenebutenolidase
VVVIHEAFGLNENIRDVARRFAAHGYAAFAVDLFAGRNRAVCTARFMGGMLRGKPRPFGVGDLERACPSSASSPTWTPKGSGL